MTKRTKKAESPKQPAKTKLHVATLDLRSPGQMNLTYYFGPRKHPTRGS